MEKVFSIKIKGEEKQDIQYIPHPELSYLLKEYMDKSPIKVEIEDDLIISNIEHHSLESSEPMRANMFLNENLDENLSLKNEEELLEKILELI